MSILSSGEQVAFNEDFNRVFKAEHDSARRDESIVDEVAELLKEGGECYPFSHVNMFEAIGQVSDGKQQIISAYFATALDYKGNNNLANHGLYTSIRLIVQEYWNDVAETIATRNVDARLS